MSIEKYYYADETDLHNWMFLNQQDKLKNYIEYHYMPYAYDDIMKFLKKLVVDIISDNVDECMDSKWSEDAKTCYNDLRSYYMKEKIDEERKLEFKKRQDTKGSLIQMAT